MPNLNRVLLMGNLTRDPEIKYTPNGTAVCELGLAINRHYTTGDGEKREETTFVDVELWGRQAEIADEFLQKGRPVFIEGRLKLDQWDDKDTGQRRSKMRVVGEMLQLLGAPQGESQERPAARQERRSEPPAARRLPPKPPRDPDLDADDDDIPF